MSRSESWGTLLSRWRLSALIPFGAFVVLFVLAYFATLQPPTLAVRGGPCDDGWCVTYVFPPGYAWLQGVRSGDVILAIDDVAAHEAAPDASWNTVESMTILRRDGTTAEVAAASTPAGESPLKWSLWTVAASFAILGSIVWSRRPDLPSAASFGRMSGVAALALAVAPAAAGPGMPWALAVQWISLAVLGPSLLMFVARLNAERGFTARWPVLTSRLLLVAALLLVITYIYCISFSPSLYRAITSVMFLLLGFSLVAVIFLLLNAILARASRTSSNALRVPLAGFFLGGLPFVLTVLLPASLGRGTLLPSHIAVLPVALIPASFAYTILRNQLWGIRRLVHRGLVYLLVSALVFGLVALAILLTDQLFSTGRRPGVVELIIIALTLLAGISIYHPMKVLARRMVDGLMYGGAVSYPEFMQSLQHDISGADAESDLPRTVMEAFAGRLDLESAILFREGDAGQLEIIATAGAQTGRVLDALNTERISPLARGRSQAPLMLPFEGEQLLCVHLWTSENMAGTLLLGPKRGGELFIQDEINLAVNAAPFMAAALDRHELSKTMRQLNQRLVETEELSRKRMAIDLHDGPLQKAVALAMGRVQGPAEQKEVATELVNELREISSRLRPSILDDLGLPSSLEWLLEHHMRGKDIRGTLMLEGMEEDSRLASDVELVLFRIAQEAINNAVKHSTASELRITLSKEEEQLTLTIRDNGAGFSGVASNNIAGSRLGLIGMRERAMQVGGRLEVHSRPGEGVFVQATVPIPAPDPTETNPIEA